MLLGGRRERPAAYENPRIRHEASTQGKSARATTADYDPLGVTAEQGDLRARAAARRGSQRAGTPHDSRRDREVPGSHSLLVAAVDVDPREPDGSQPSLEEVPQLCLPVARLRVGVQSRPGGAHQPHATGGRAAEAEQGPVH